MKKAIFLDRDGVLNLDKHYVHKVEDLEIQDGNIEALNGFKNMGYLLIVISNQSGIARGYFDIEDVNKFNDALEKKLEIQFDKIYFCPHKKEDNCDCRKPEIANFLKANEIYNIDFANSFMIGDRDSDIKAGKNAGCQTVLISGDMYETHDLADYKVNNLLDFYNILKNDL